MFNQDPWWTSSSLPHRALGYEYKPDAGYGLALGRANPYPADQSYSPFCFAMIVLATFVGTSAYVLNTIEYEARPAVLERRSPT